MLYIVKNNGKFMLNAKDIETIKKYGGEKAEIVYSWDENNQREALKDFFSKPKMDESTLELCAVADVDIKNMREYIDSYYRDRSSMIEMLHDVEAISPEEEKELTELSEKSKEKQLDLLAECYAHNPLDKTKKR